MPRPAPRAWRSATLLAAAATLALLATGIAPANASSDPAPDIQLPTTTDPETLEGSELPASLRAKVVEGAGTAFDARPDGSAAGPQKEALNRASGATDTDDAAALEVGTASISGTITYWKDGTPVGPLGTGRVQALRWDGTIYALHGYADADDATGQYVLGDLPAGDYVLHFFDGAFETPLISEFWHDVPYLEYTEVITLADGQSVVGADEQLEPLLKSRLAGADRYETSVAVSKAGFAPDVPCVFIANGLNFPDALSASPAAAHCGGPLLLIPGWTIPQTTIDEIKRLSPERIVVAGGTLAVTAQVEQDLRALAPQFVRYAGADRFDTSRRIVAGEFGTSPAAWVASGLNFPDALSASAAAAAADIPVLIVPGTDGALDANSANAITALQASDIAVAGGPVAVSWGIVEDIRELPTAPWTFRIGGETRYDTAFMIMDLVWEGAFAPYAFFASGLNFPDALSGAPLAGLAAGPLYITPAECTPLNIQAQVEQLEVADAFVLGYYQKELYYNGWEPFASC